MCKREKVWRCNNWLKMAAKLRGENVLVKKGVFEGAQSEGKKKDIDPVERRGRVRKRKQTCVQFIQLLLPGLAKL